MLVVADKFLPEEMSGLIHMFEEIYVPLFTLYKCHLLVIAFLQYLLLF